MRHGNRREPFVIAVVCGTLLSLGLHGCACTEDVSILNSTADTIRVQFAYPWPAYAIAADSGCHFEFSLAPEEIWRSKSARGGDATTLVLAQPNGCVLVRISEDVATWRLFGVMNDAPIASLSPITLTVSDNEGGLAVTASSHDGQPISVEELDDSFWFRSR